MQAEASRTIRILHVEMRHKGWTGESTRILLLCRGLVGRGHEVVLAGPEGSPLMQRAAEHGLRTWPHFTLPRKFRPVQLYRESGALSRYMSREHFDICHTHGSLDTWGSLAACWRLRTRPLLVRTRHNTFPVATHVFNRLLYRRWIDRTVAISSAVGDVLAKDGLVEREALPVVPDAVDLERFDPALTQDTLRAISGIPRDAPVIGDVARLSTSKGLVVFIETAAKVLARYPQAHFVVCGEGSKREMLVEHARSLGVADHVHLVGMIDDVPGALAGMDIFLHCSFAEGLGTSVLEALAMARPVIATAVGGTVEFVHHASTGLHIPPHDSEAAANAVCSLLQDRTLADRLGRAGRTLVEREYSAERLAERTEAVYANLLASRRPR